MNKNKVILTDCDGVILDWEEGFPVWMEHTGHNKVEGHPLKYSIGDNNPTKEQGNKLVKQFNESVPIGGFLRDAHILLKNYMSNI